MSTERNLFEEVEEVEQAVANANGKIDNLTLFAARIESKMDRILSVVEAPAGTPDLNPEDQMALDDVARAISRLKQKAEAINTGAPQKLGQ